MPSKYSLPNTFKLVGSTNVSVIFGENNEICGDLARNICCYHFENYECFNAEKPSEVLNKVKKLLTQYETEHLAKLDLFVIDFDKISSMYDSKKFFELLLELNEFSKANTLKTLVLFTTENNSLISKVYSNFTTEQQQQILFLRMNTNPVKLTIETGKHKGESISYEVRTELRFMQEVKKHKVKNCQPV